LSRPLLTHCGPLLTYSNPLLTHCRPLLTYSNPLLTHCRPLLRSIMGCIVCVVRTVLFNFSNIFFFFRRSAFFIFIFYFTREFQAQCRSAEIKNKKYWKMKWYSSTDTRCIPGTVPICRIFYFYFLFHQRVAQPICRK